ncbi:MAG: RNA 2',3'-cyclic phosphodiesterase [Acidobacteriota bacterium]|nr:RNA 2',3'-cyclic phosphodiesterase [Acidobacteriota bacterium]
MSQAPDSPTARVFFALWPNEAEGGALAAWQEPLRHACGGRAMRRETLHMTLVFLGEVERTRLPSLRAAAQVDQVPGFELCFDTVHLWKHNHIVYAAPDHVPPHLPQLVTALEQALDEHGFKFDRRGYKPHITLLRNIRPPQDELPQVQPARWRIMDFALMQSVPQGGVMGYRVLDRFPLLAVDGT